MFDLLIILYYFICVLNNLQNIIKAPFGSPINALSNKTSNLPLTLYYLSDFIFSQHLSLYNHLSRVAVAAWAITHFDYLFPGRFDFPLVLVFHLIDALAAWVVEFVGVGVEDVGLRVGLWLGTLLRCLR